jgi:hypothetical protein
MSDPIPREQKLSLPTLSSFLLWQGVAFIFFRIPAIILFCRATPLSVSLGLGLLGLEIAIDWKFLKSTKNEKPNQVVQPTSRPLGG